MLRIAEIENASHPLQSPLRVGICDTFFHKLRGFMFYPSIELDQGLVFIEKEDSKLNTSIHMFFMNFDISVIWINRQFDVVDTILARKWHPYYFPSHPACYTLEIHPSRLFEFHNGDKITIKNV
jgi:uncharacterized membrane protein (UPF0127 family)